MERRFAFVIKDLQRLLENWSYDSAIQASAHLRQLLTSSPTLWQRTDSEAHGLPKGLYVNCGQINNDAPIDVAAYYSILDVNIELKSEVECVTQSVKLIPIAPMLMSVCEKGKEPVSYNPYVLRGEIWEYVGYKRVADSDFLKQDIVAYGDKTYTVGNIISFLANAENGVHIGKGREKQNTVGLKETENSDSGIKPSHSITAIKSIAQVVCFSLRGLANKISDHYKI